MKQKNQGGKHIQPQKIQSRLKSLKNKLSTIELELKVSIRVDKIEADELDIELYILKNYNTKKLVQNTIIEIDEVILRTEKMIDKVLEQCQINH